MSQFRGKLIPLDVAAYNLALPDMCELLTSVEPYMPKDGSMAKFALACVHVTFQQTGKLPTFKSLKRWIINKSYPQAFAVWPTIRRILSHHGYTALKPTNMVGGQYSTRQTHPVYHFPFSVTVTEVTQEQLDWLRENDWTVTKSQEKTS